MTAALEGGEWSAARPGCTLPQGKTRYPFLQEAGWVPGPVWMGVKSHPHWDSIPDHPARSQSLHRLSYPALSNIVAWNLTALSMILWCSKVILQEGWSRNFQKWMQELLYDVCCVVVLLCKGVTRCNRHPGLFLWIASFSCPNMSQ